MKKEIWLDLKNILCVRLDNLGDVLMTSPAIRALKHSVRDRRISLLTSKAGSGIAQFLPEIDETVVFDVPWMKNENLNTGSNEVLKMINILSSYKFDGAVIFTNFSQNPLPPAMICYLAGIPRVLGYCRENPYKLLTDWVPDKEPFEFVQHGVLRQLKLAEQTGADIEDDRIKINLKKHERHSLLVKLESLGINTDKPLFVFHVGASEVKRQYPVDYFAKAAKLLKTKYDCEILATGTVGEKELVDTFVRLAGKSCHSLAGRLDVGELIALIKTSDVLISNNTGPVHIAAGVQTPVVVLYAKTNPEHTPWKVPNKVLYFDVPENLRSKNRILRMLDYKDKSELPSQDKIVSAVDSLFKYNIKKNSKKNGDLVTPHLHA